jgi:hypothetical protein
MSRAWIRVSIALLVVRTFGAEGSATGRIATSKSEPFLHTPQKKFGTRTGWN